METSRSPGLRQLFAAGEERCFAKGEAVGSTDEQSTILLILDGYIKRYMIGNDGRLHVQVIYGPHDIFSFTRIYQLLLGQSLYVGPEVYHYKTMSRVRALSISTNRFAKAVAADAGLYRELFAEAGHHLKACIQSIENAGLPSVPAQVAHQLVFFAREFGDAVPDGVSIRAPLTHQDIADVVGTTRETVTRALTELRHRGLLEPDKKHLIITDVERLKIEAYA